MRRELGIKCIYRVNFVGGTRLERSYFQKKITTTLADTGDRVSATLPKDTGRVLSKRAFYSLFHAGANTGRVT